MLEVGPNSCISYESRKEKPHLLLLLINKYVRISLLKNLTLCGFVHSIDPISYSIIILQLRDDHYYTTVIPGHAVINVEEVNPGKDIKIPATKVFSAPSIECYEDRKKKIMSWFKENLLTVSESGENIVFGNVLILPPYKTTDICTDNPIVAMQVINIMNKMPDNY